ncbi:hypothetical protein ACF0H5_022248 [Mactra antiquata]
MGNTKRFVIVITSPQMVFNPGECIEGQVHVDLAADMKMRGLSVSCTSLGEAVWRRGNQIHRAKEDYLNLKLTLYGHPPNEGGEVVLPAGTHVFPFKFVLPNDLPGSYEGEKGAGIFVRHWLRAVMDRPWKTNKDYRIMFSVASILDLNSIPDAAEPVQVRGKRDPSVMCCCYSGEVTANFRLDKKGYVPGESIVIHGEVVDCLNIGITAVFVELFRKTIFTKDANGIIYDDLTPVARLRHSRVAAGGSDLWNGEKLRIPPLAPSYLPGCNIMDLNYYLKITVQLPGLKVGSHLVLTLPIIIGTVPLYSTVRQNMAVDGTTDPQEIQPVMSQPQSSGMSHPLPAYTPDDIPPPSYQECVFGKVDTINDDEPHTAGDKTYAPLYTYYESMV